MNDKIKDYSKQLPSRNFTINLNSLASEFAGFNKFRLLKVEYLTENLSHLISREEQKEKLCTIIEQALLQEKARECICKNEAEVQQLAHDFTLADHSGRAERG